MRFKTIMCFNLAVLLSLSLTSFGTATLSYNAFTEIVTLGEYPEDALPPGNIYKSLNTRSADGRNYFEARLDASVFPGWVFVGWVMDEDFLKIYDGDFEIIDDVTNYDGWGNQLYSVRFEIRDDVTAKAVYAYVGKGSVFDELSKPVHTTAPSAEEKVTYAVGVYERDPVSGDGDYGTLLCYPYVFSNDMNIPAGETILLAALPKDGFQFDCWRVFEEGKKGFDQPKSNVLIFTVAAPFSIDAIFKPVIVR